jgi:ABC-2 type transport system ATP-binding protein
MPVESGRTRGKTPPMNGVIELDGLGLRFGRRRILKNLRGSLSGRAIGLLGPNGAGKTTLIHTLLGFHPASEGTARIYGRDIRSDHKAICGLTGYMPETDAFIAGMSAVRLVRLMAELSGLPRRPALERAHEALFYVGLGEARYRNLETYSLGMKQLAKLAQAIVHGPKLLFLDEPTNGLDPRHRQRMIHMIRDIRDSGDVHIILSSHLLRDVEECCDEVLILKEGEVAQYCNLEEERKANRKFIEVETQDDNAVFAEEIGKLGCEYALLNNRRIKMVLPERIEIRQLYEVAAAREIQIRRLDYKRDSLQDIFLKAMNSKAAGRPAIGGA